MHLACMCVYYMNRSVARSVRSRLSITVDRARHPMPANATPRRASATAKIPSALAHVVSRLDAIGCPPIHHPPCRMRRHRIAPIDGVLKALPLQTRRETSTLVCIRRQFQAASLSVGRVTQMFANSLPSESNPYIKLKKIKSFLNLGLLTRNNE